MNKKYLQPGPQTEKDQNIDKTVNKFKEKNFELIFEILKWIHKNLKYSNNKKLKKELFRKRSASQIIRDGFVLGCTDWALSFIVLARAKKIPTIYVETVRNKWIEEGTKDFLEGHVFTECYINKKWYIIDPERAVICGYYDRYKVIDRGLDSWDIGIKNYSDLKKKFTETKAKFF